MEFATTYLGKSLVDLVYADVERFFATEKQESDQIEFKSCNPNGPIEAKLTGIIEGITAFLNSGGGLLIWGAPEGIKMNGRKEKAFIGSLTKLPLTVEKDWLISKIVDKIIPMPIGIRVQLLAAANSQIAVFEVDESIYAPHQTSNTYFMRVDGQNKPAPHHYIEALFKKISFPRLEAYIKPRGTTEIDEGFELAVDFFFVNFSPFINEESMYYRIIVAEGVFQGAKGSPSYHAGGPSYGISTALDFGMNGQEYRSKKGFPLFFGEPYSFSKKLYFPKSRIARMDNQAKLLIFFGGKTAPMKYCQYNIDFRQVVSGRMTYGIDFQNRLMLDKHRENDSTEADVLNGMGVLT